LAFGQVPEKGLVRDEAGHGGDLPQDDQGEFAKGELSERLQ